MTDPAEVKQTPRWLVTGGTIVVLVALVIAFWIVLSVQSAANAARANQRAMLQVLDQVHVSTAPNNPAVTRIILCLENHQDRATAALMRVTPPPPKAGCP